MRSVVDRNGSTLVKHVEEASSFSSRMIGLLGRKELPQGHALYITRCGSIHTFFMRFSLDLIFVDTDLKIVKIASNITPFRIVFGGARARAVFEVQTGWLDSSALSRGDVLTMQ